MAEEDRPPTVDVQPEQPKSEFEAPPATAGQDAPTQPEAVEGPQESKTRGMLREVIQKVMEEIEYHEKEARKHWQQAKELRKDLRESIAFLQDEGKKGHARESSSDTANQVAEDKTKNVAPADKHPQTGMKKRPSGKKARG